MTSFIPKQPKVMRDRVEAKLEVGLIQTLEQYCEYLDSDRDYVIGQVLAIAFKKDKGFVEWQQTHQPSELRELPSEEAAPQVKRGRKPNRPDRANQNSRGTAATTDAAPALDAMDGRRE